MIRPLLVVFFLFIFTLANGQTSYKSTETMSFNLVTGYQSFPSSEDINQRLTANQFERLKASPFTLGIELTVAGKKAIAKTQFRGTSIFMSHKVKRPTLQPASISIQYGIDVLRKAPKTYLYPFGGIRYANWTLWGRSAGGTKLAAVKNNFDATVGLGLKQFLNDDLQGFFNNIDLNIGIAVPLSNGRWQPYDETDATFIKGTYKNQQSYFVLLTIGRAFRL